ncbi:terpene synthase family protein [Streptomyces mobaraensis]|uniref:terpene synthase family protein n=1 Tax=Streptomyces mobaraensis TaxID=35621 RepID=UPI0033272C92
MPDTLPVPELSYPFPTVVSPFETDESFHDERDWYETYYGFLPEEDRAKYKEHDLAQGAAYMSPTVTDPARLRPMARWFVFLTQIDDYHEFHTVPELVAVRDRVRDILSGEEPHDGEPGYLRFLARMRAEFQEFMPYLWLERLAHSFHEFFTYGVMEEAPYKLGKRSGPPSLAHYLLIHEYSIAMRPYGDLVEPAMGGVLPDSVFRHPVVQRLRSLICRLMSVQNDLHSLAKEEARPSECVNIVPVLCHELGCTRGEAVAEAVRILDSFSAEILALGRQLPDFGPHQEQVREYFRQMQLMVTGLERWYRYSRSTRYRIPGAFPDVAPDARRRP